MKIYTKTGDRGETSLLDGKRVAKNHLRIEAYGTIDELNSFIGLIRDVAPCRDYHETLQNIQDQLFGIGSQLALPAGNTKIKLEELKETEVVKLEKAIDAMNQELPELRNFIVPGGDVSASYSHVARSICRRAERRVVELQQVTDEVDEAIIHYLNRLSDYLFTQARYYTMRNKGTETLWKTRG